VPTIGSGNLEAGERVGVILGNFDNSPNSNWEIHNDGQVRISWNNGELDLFGTTDLRDDTWHHLAFVRDTAAGEFRVYIDGVEETLTTHVGAGADITFAANHRIGSDNRNGAAAAIAFHGAIDELAIYDRALTPTEIVARAAGNIDQRGLPRIVGSGVDIGAYESQIIPSADFDTDGDVDGADFLAWQRGFGTPNAQRADGNSDDDMDTDASDLAAWEVSFGLPQPPSTASAPSRSALAQATTIPASPAVEPFAPAALIDAALIDAALALEWLGSDSDEETSFVTEQATIEAVLASGDELEDLLAPTGSIASHLDSVIVSSDHVESTVKSTVEPTVESTTERWLADELLERVFG